MNDLEIMIRKMNHNNIERGLILRNEKANDTYNTGFVTALYREEAKGMSSFYMMQSNLYHLNILQNLPNKLYKTLVPLPTFYRHL